MDNDNQNKMPDEKVSELNSIPTEKKENLNTENTSRNNLVAPKDKSFIEKRADVLKNLRAAAAKAELAEKNSKTKKYS